MALQLIQKYIDMEENGYDQGLEIKFDNHGNIFIEGFYYGYYLFNRVTGELIYKYNMNQYGAQTRGILGENDNVYIIAYFNSSEAYVFKYTVDVNINTMDYEIMIPYTTELPQTLVLDRNGNFFVGIASSVQMNYDGKDYWGRVDKYNPSGTLIWSFYTDEVITGLGLQTDSENNVYILPDTNYGEGYRSVIYKVDSNGNLLWYCPLPVIDSDNLNIFTRIYIDSKNRVFAHYAWGDWTGNNKQFICRISQEGTHDEGAILNTRLLWYYEVQNQAPAFSVNEMDFLYVGDIGGIIYKFTIDGELIWSYDLNNFFPSGIMGINVTNNGDILVTGLFASDISGSQYYYALRLWDTDYGPFVDQWESGPPVGTNLSVKEGTWKAASHKVKSNGNWIDPVATFVKSGGTWTQI